MVKYICVYNIIITFRNLISFAGNNTNTSQQQQEHQPQQQQQSTGGWVDMFDLKMLDK